MDPRFLVDAAKTIDSTHSAIVIPKCRAWVIGPFPSQVWKTATSSTCLATYISIG